MKRLAALALVATLTACTHHTVAPHANPAPPPVEHGLSIARLGIAAPLEQVQFAGDDLEVPQDIHHVGLWHDGAALDDTAGTVVIDGHVADDHDQPGALYHLDRVRVGDAVTVDGHAFRVSRVSRYAKPDLPTSLFGQHTAKRLALISCTDRVVNADGTFRHTENLVVIAEPVPAAGPARRAPAPGSAHGSG